jgi:predicted O-methyltransferase YrrM
MYGQLKRCAKFLVPAGILQLYQQRGRQASDDSLVGAEPILPAHDLAELMPGIEAVKVSIQASQLTDRHRWTLPIRELMVLAAVCCHVRPLRIFEFGTFTGCSTLAMAMNSLAETEIISLDLDPNDRGSRRFDVGEAYRGTAFASKIRQLLGDSRTVDYSSFYQSMDLVFIDANHTYPFVKADSDNAFELLSPGGIIIWDDYVWDANRPWDSGVARYLNELARQKPCYRIKDTRLAIYIDHNGRSTREIA